MSFLRTLKEKVSSKLSNQELESTLQPDTDELSADSDDLDNQQQNDQSADGQSIASLFAVAKGVWNQGANTVKAVLSSNDSVETIEEAEESIEEAVVTTTEAALGYETEKAGSLLENMKEVLSQGVDKLKGTVTRTSLADASIDESGDETGNSEDKIDENQSITDAKESGSLTAVAVVMAGSAFSLMKSALTNIDMPDSIVDTAKGLLNRKDNEDLQNNESETSQSKTVVDDTIQEAETGIETIAANTRVTEGVDSVSETTENILEKTNAEVNVSNDEAEESNNLTRVATVAAVGSVFGLLKTSLSKGIDTIKDATSDIDTTGSLTDIAKNALNKGTDALKNAATNFNTSETSEVAETVISVANEKTVDETVDVDEIIADSLEPETVVETLTTDARTTIDDIEPETAEAVAEEVDTDGVKADRVKDIEDIEDIVDERADVEEIVGDSLESETVVETHTADARTTIDDIEPETVGVVAEVVDADEVKAVRGENIVDERVDVEEIVADRLEPETGVETLTAEANTAIDDTEQEALETATNTETEPDSTCEAVVDTVEIKSPRSDSTIVTAVNTFGTTFESENKVLKAEAEERPETVDLNRSDAWRVEDNTVAGSNPFNVDKGEEAAIPAFDAYDESNLGMYAEPEKKTRYGWVLPVVLLSLFSAAWWLNFAPGRQSSGDVDFAMIEEVPVEQSELNSVAMNTAYEEPVSKLTSVDEDVRRSEESASADILAVDASSSDEGVFEEPSETSSVGLGADYEGPLSKLASVDEGIVPPEAISAKVLVVEDELETQGEAVGLLNTPVAGVEVVAMIQEPVVAEQENNSPVDAVARFLATNDRESLPKGFVLYGLNFETASSRISKDSARIISDLASTLETYPTTRIRLEGHTDNRGNADKNLALSNNRARAVKAALVSLNLDSARINALGLGDEYPIMDNETKMGQAENRRVEIIITEQ